MKIDQCAFYATTDDQADQIKAQFGLTDAVWIKDTVTARSIVNGVDDQNVANLEFNYDLGIEFEILRYVDGKHWHLDNPAYGPKPEGSVIPPFISHVGIHLDDGEEFPAMEHCKLVQETFTISHTAKYLTSPASPAAGRLYHYRIFEMSPGSYIKYIRRIHPK